MNVLIWSCGDEIWSAAPFVYKEAKAQGLDVRIAGTRSNPQPVFDAIKQEKPDVIFCFAIHYAHVDKYKQIRNMGIKLVLWYPDMTEESRDRI